MDSRAVKLAILISCGLFLSGSDPSCSLSRVECQAFAAAALDHLPPPTPERIGAPVVPAPASAEKASAGAERKLAGDDPRRADDGVTLNMVSVPIPQAAKIVLGDIMGFDFIIDPKVEGALTIHTARPLTKSAAVSLFQMALRSSGAALVEANGVYKIVPLEQAATAGGDIAVGGHSGPARVGGGVDVVRLRYVSASEMKRLLEPITLHGGVVAADEERHTLSLSGSPQEVAALKEAIAAFDTDTMRGMTFMFVPVTSSDPDTMAEELRSAFGSSKDGPMGGMLRFIANRRLSGILVISSQPQYLERARAWIRRLDTRAQDTEKQFFSYRVKNRPAKELLKVVNAMFGGSEGRGSSVSPRNGVAAMASDSGAEPGGTEKSTVFGGSAGSLGSGASLGNANGAMAIGGSPTGPAPGPAPAGPNGGPLSSGGAFAGSASASNGTAALGEDSRFKLAVDDAKNTLVIMASPDDYKRLIRVIHALDVQPGQVFIEAMIAEVTLNDNLNFGVQWFFQHRSSSVGLSNVATTPSPVNDNLGNNLLGAGVGAVFPGFSYALRAGSAMATVNALNEVTTVHVLSTPSLTVLDNREASLQVGDQVPITTFTGSSINSNRSFFNGTQYLSTGVILAITPHISDSGSLMLEIEQEVSNVSADTPANATNPTIQQRKVKTQVVVADGEALMLGGLIQDQHNKSATQIPVLGDLPVVGNAFKQKSDTITKTELLIMITPHIVKSPAGARSITEEYRRKAFEIAREAKTRPHTIETTAKRTLLDP